MPAFKQLVSKYPHSNYWLRNLIIETSSFKIPAFEYQSLFRNIVIQTINFQVPSLKQAVLKYRQSIKYLVNNFFKTSSFQILRLVHVIHKYGN